MIEVFGYGSLVNRRTQDFGGARVTLAGWRRVWVTTSERPAAFLSVEPAEAEIEGLSFPVAPAVLPALDEREAQYDRLPRQGGVVYSVPAANQTPGAAPILRSYLDVVLQGYLAEFGAAGVERFMATTTSWERGILDDRAAPLYPRAQVLTAEETAHFDALVASIPVVEQT
ncbi:MAG: gamma-glutamylcyclotransferase family protein [Pseudomonadota bacterium]